jgi:hypothetical protein
MTTTAMNAISQFIGQAKEARDLLEGTMADVVQDQAVDMPGGKVVSIAANYAHVITSQDFGLHGVLKGSTPLIASTWATKSGLSSPPPFGPGSAIDEWARDAKIDLKELCEYAQAVYIAADEHFGSMTDDDFNRPIDLSAFGFGQQPASFIAFNGWVANVYLHTGEISCLKGLEGAKGYPF